MKPRRRTKPTAQNIILQSLITTADKNNLQNAVHVKPPVRLQDQNVNLLELE